MPCVQMYSDLNVVAERPYAVPVSSFRSLATATVLVGLFVGGCAEDNCEIPTDEIRMDARVTDNGVTIRAEFEFRSGGPGPMSTPWSCDESARFEINGSEATKIERDNKTEYSLTVDTVDETRSFSFELTRDGEDDVRASVELPPPFEITAPEPGAMLPRSRATELAWTPPLEGGEMRIKLVEEIGNGLCVTTDSEDHNYKSRRGERVDDIGMWTIPEDALGSDLDESCDARYELSRFSEGEYPGELADGGVVAGQVLRAVVFVSEP